MDLSNNFSLKNNLFDLIQECTDKALSYVNIKTRKKMMALLLHKQILK